MIGAPVMHRADHHRRRVRRRLARRAAAERLRGRLPGQDDRRPGADRRLAAVRRRLPRRRAAATRSPSALHVAEGRRSAMANDKTEKATPKKSEDARKKGQVAKSADINGAASCSPACSRSPPSGPKAMEQMQARDASRCIDLIARPRSSTARASATLFADGRPARRPRRRADRRRLLRRRPRRQRRARSASSRRREAIKPDFKKLNPASGLKNLFNPQHFAVRDRQERRQGRDRRRDRRARACSPSSTSWPRWSACRRRSCSRMVAAHGHDDRPARRGRLPA